MDLIVEKATELGAAVIAPLLSERTVVRADEGEALSKREKWQRVAIEAAKQCGQNWLPSVAKPVALKEFFAQGGKYDMKLIASLQPGAVSVKQALAEAGAKRPGRVLVLVGPEGDFTPAEVNLARNHGCQPITLGPIILRTGDGGDLLRERARARVVFLAADGVACGGHVDFAKPRKHVVTHGRQ